MPYDTSLSSEGPVLIVKVKGTFVGPRDKDAIEAKVQELVEQGHTSIILDLGEVSFLDSSGIGGLIAAFLKASRKGGSVKLVHVTRRIHEVLQITRLSSVFEMFDDLQKALKSFEVDINES